MKSERSVNCLPTKIKSMLFELSRHQRKVDFEGYSVGLPVVLEYKGCIYSYWRTLKIVDVSPLLK